MDSVDVDWDLQAVVTGHGGGGGGGRTMCFSNSVMDEEEVIGGEDYCSYVGFRDELNQLYRPFCPGLCNNIQPSSIHVDQEKMNKKKDEQEQPRIPISSTGSSSVKYRTRKNQKKRSMVIQVTAEGLPSDLWALRKYGQKSIKGSPFPRSYYKCSSSKGCLARKQVERSCKDFDTFEISYTGYHCHSLPTRRSSLAGTSHQKFSSSTKEYVEKI